MAAHRGSAQDRLAPRLARAAGVVRAARERELRPLGLTAAQYAALYTLDQAPELSGAQLARVCLVSPQAMATVLAGLQRRGLITRAPSAVHSQVLLSVLTGPGRDLLEQARTRSEWVERRLAAALSAAERATLLDLLERTISAALDRPDGS